MRELWPSAAFATPAADGVAPAYRAFLEELQLGGELDCKDLNFDTGAATKPGEYVLADKTYSKLPRQLGEVNWRTGFLKHRRWSRFVWVISPHRAIRVSIGWTHGVVYP